MTKHETVEQCVKTLRGQAVLPKDRKRLENLKIDLDGLSKVPSSRYFPVKTELFTKKTTTRTNRPLELNFILRVISSLN